MTNHEEIVQLTCKNGHISDHLLDRVLRYNDAWCGRCGAALPYVSDSPARAEVRLSEDARVTPGFKLRIAEADPIEPAAAEADIS